MIALYEIRLPQAQLRPFIECYWFLNATIGAPCQLEELIYTDARADIVFTFGSPYLRVRADRPAEAQLMRASNVDAQRRFPVRIYHQGRLHLVGVRFRPGGLSPFVRTPVHELSGYTLTLKDVFGRRGVELEEKLFFATGETQEQAHLLDQFFLSRLAVLPEYARVMSWLKAIEAQRGMVSILELSRLSGLSVRSVDRLFQQVIGLPPKFVARTVRFRHALHHLMAQPATRWDEIVAALDYFDQSHFIRDVKSLAGVDPKTYLAFLSRRRESLAPNHVHLAVLP